MLVVEAKGQAEKIGLFGAGTETVVGKIADRVRLEIEDGEGLFSGGGVGAEAAVQEHGVPRVG